MAGGIYGVLIGGVFCGESMFHRATDASKVALVDLAARLIEARAGLLEVQHATPHLRSLGAIEIPRAVYLGLLRELRDDSVHLVCDRLPASRLLEPGVLSGV
jgi:leucyl/phenylalanyl-tRNA--protein transferase